MPNNDDDDDPMPTDWLHLRHMSSWAWLTKNLSTKSDFSQMPPSRSGFDSEHFAQTRT